MSTSRSWGPTAWRAAGLKREQSAGAPTEPTMYEKEMREHENNVQSGRVTFAEDSCDVPEEFWLDKATPTLKRSRSAPPTTANKTSFVSSGLTVKSVLAHNAASAHDTHQDARPRMDPSLSKGSLRMPQYLSAPKDNFRGNSCRSPPETFWDRKGDSKVEMRISSVDSVASCLQSTGST